jgi:hypothetical protein
MSPILHVAFTDTGAADLREALKTSGRDDAVVSLADNLSFGPIDPVDPEARWNWVEKELGFAGWPSTPEQDGDNGWEDISARAHTFWNEGSPSGIERSPGSPADPQWNMLDSWNGSGDSATHRARWSI